ncbi:unnamed protein product, partial [Mesorhabditis spiculigera]
MLQNAVKIFWIDLKYPQEKKKQAAAVPIQKKSIPKVVVTQPSNGNLFPRPSVSSSYGSEMGNYQKTNCCCCSIL